MCDDREDQYFQGAIFRLCCVRYIGGNSFDPPPGFTSCSSTSECSSKLEIYWASLRIPHLQTLYLAYLHIFEPKPQLGWIRLRCPALRCPALRCAALLVWIGIDTDATLFVLCSDNNYRNTQTNRPTNFRSNIPTNRRTNFASNTSSICR